MLRLLKLFNFLGDNDSDGDGMKDAVDDDDDNDGIPDYSKWIFMNDNKILKTTQWIVSNLEMGNPYQCYLFKINNLF